MMDFFVAIIRAFGSRLVFVLVGGIICLCMLDGLVTVVEGNGPIIQETEFTSNIDLVDIAW